MLTTIIASVLGIISTLAAWFLNPKRATYAELDSIYKELENAYSQRDVALAKNDSDTLTIITANIIQLSTRKTVLLQRLG
jgi:hypothetical protein